MSKEAARRKREKAIRTLRECGMSDAEIEAELGFPLSDQDSEDAQTADIVEAELVDNLPAVIKPVQGGRTTHESAEPIQDRLWPQGPTPERRCKAHSTRTGERCKNAAMLGTTVCRYHGALAPQVKAAARARLENAADRMARNLLGLATEAESETVKLGATNSALDRAGLKPPAEVVLSQGNTKPYQEVFDHIASGSRAESRAARGFVDNSEPSSNATGCAAGYVSGTDTHRTPAGVDSFPVSPALTDHENRDPAPPASTQAAEDGARDAQQRGEASRRRSQDSRSASARHVTGDDALRVAAQFTREQLAIESPHKRYKRPW